MLIEESKRLGIQSLIAFIKGNKYPYLMKRKESEMCKEEKRKLKYFYPTFLTTEDQNELKVKKMTYNL